MGSACPQLWDKHSSIVAIITFWLFLIIFFFFMLYDLNKDVPIRFANIIGYVFYQYSSKVYSVIYAISFLSTDHPPQYLQWYRAKTFIGIYLRVLCCLSLQSWISCSPNFLLFLRYPLLYPKYVGTISTARW